MNAAFKEWEVVVEALGRGDQIVIMRRGGLDEGPNGFEVMHQKFWLFPTRFHQQSEMVVPEAMRDRLPSGPAGNDPATVSIQFACEVVTHLELSRIDQIARLRGQHVWKDEVLIKRMTSGDRNSLHALLVRVFKLQDPRSMPMHGDYAGCKSWTQLHSAPNESKLQPVLDDASFKQKALAFEQAIQ